MNSALEFSLALVAIVVVAGAYALRHVDSIKDYFKTPTGLGILKGVVLAIVFSLTLATLGALTGCSGTYLNEASVYAGLDNTKKVSPQCEKGGQDDRITSNLGAKVNIYRSQDEKFKANAKYTHHSCAFGVDRYGYDALGVELEYKIWSR